MGFFNELGYAFKVTALVACSGRFWAAIVTAMFNPLLLAVLGGMTVLTIKVDFMMLYMSLYQHDIAPSTIATLAALIFCYVMIVPLFMYAWCPVAARAVRETMQLDVSELQAPSLGRFIGGWLVVVIIMLILVVGAFFGVPRAYFPILLLPAALLYGSYLLRGVLCLHADRRETDTIATATLARRTFVWFPLAALLMYLVQQAEYYAREKFLGIYDSGPSTASRAFDTLASVVNSAFLAIVIVFFAALALQVLAALAGRESGKRPATVPASSRQSNWATVPAARGDSRPRKARSWLPIMFVVLVCGAGLSYLSRLALYHQYLVASDPRYALQVMRAEIGLNARDYLRLAFESAACDGDLARIKRLLQLGLEPATALGKALVCAAGHDQDDIVGFLLAKGADVNFSTYNPTLDDSTAPASALQYAVQRKNTPLVALLLSKGADPSPRSGQDGMPAARGALYFAAINRDTDMIALLIKAGANPHPAQERSPIFDFVEASTVAGGSAQSWALVITAAERAGLRIGATNPDGGNLLHLAAGKGQFGLIDVLLARGLDRHAHQKGVQPFMLLAFWYHHQSVEPGPELELALKALTSGVANINKVASLSIPTEQDDNWTIASGAVAKRRLRLLFADQINYAMLTEREWLLPDREQAQQLVDDLSARQLGVARALPAALRQNGWNDLAALAEHKGKLAPAPGAEPGFN